MTSKASILTTLFTLLIGGCHTGWRSPTRTPLHQATPLHQQENRGDRDSSDPGDALGGRRNSPRRDQTLKNLREKLRENTSDLESARREIARGKKTSHWIWYIFPQHIKLSSSPNNKLYAMKSFQMTKNFLEDEDLKAAYLENCTILQKSLENKRRTIKSIFGSDSVKVISSLTLFYEAAKNNSHHQDLFQAISAIKAASPFYWDQRTLGHIADDQTP